MLLKISGETKERFESNLNRFINLSTMICLKGYIPTEADVEKAKYGGNWWTYEEDNERYNLASGLNDNWFNIKKTGENYLIGEFHFRYGKDLKQEETIENLMLIWFDFVSIVE